jgi:hypothetical protein
MREVEKEMVEAVRNWTPRVLGNTEVCCAPFKGGYGCVMLFGNTIAYFDEGAEIITLRDGGYRSATTKSRLNALLNDTGYRIWQRKGEWHLYYYGQPRGLFENDSQFYIGTGNDTDRTNP